MPCFQSILLISDDPLGSLATEFNLRPGSTSIDDLLIQSDTTIGIDAIREAKRFAATPPVLRPQKQIAVIAANTLTVEAQNALLKLLEEPPDYLQIILASTTSHQLLETITSRCQLLTVKTAQAPAASTELLTLLMSTPPVDRLDLLPATNTRDAALDYCRQLVAAAASLLRIQPTSYAAANLEILLDCQSHLAQNTNPSLSLTDAILRLQTGS